MRILLLVLGLLAMASGGLKFRDRIRTRIGTSPFSLGELGLGGIAGILAISGADPTPMHSGVAGLTVIAMIFAGIHQSRLAAAFQHRRDVSESHRLKRFVEVANLTSGQTPTRLPADIAAPADKVAVNTSPPRPPVGATPPAAAAPPRKASPQRPTASKPKQGKPKQV